MTSNRWSDLDRPPLNQAALRKALLGEGSLWTDLEVVESIGSTNTELASRAREGASAPGSILVAEEQTAGKGRLDRAWTAPPRSGLFFSMLFRPEPRRSAGAGFRSWQEWPRREPSPARRAWTPA